MNLKQFKPYISFFKPCISLFKPCICKFLPQFRNSHTLFIHLPPNWTTDNLTIGVALLLDYKSRFPILFQRLETIPHQKRYVNFCTLSCIYSLLYHNWFVSVMFVNLMIMIIFWTKSLDTYLPFPHTFFLILLCLY